MTYKNFQRLKVGLDTYPALCEILNLNSWDWLNLRKMFPASCHKDSSDIVLRFAPMNQRQTFETLMNGIETTSYWSWYAHEQVRKLIKTALEGMVKPEYELGRVMITRLAPGKGIGAHRDEGGYADAHERFHICLSAGIKGTSFICGEESVSMQPGELWRFNHRELHSVVNGSDSDRINLIVDIKI